MRIFALLITLLLTACVNTSLNSAKEFEEYPLRPATEEEVKKIDACLSALLHAERAFFEKHKKYNLRPASMGVDAECNGIQVSMHKRGTGYLAQAQFNEKENTVRWIMDETGHAEESAEIGSDSDLDF